jgi:predicted Zn finger-like uncharacterized protein
MQTWAEEGELALQKENRFWPVVDSPEKAIKLMHGGAFAAALGCALTTAFSVAAIFLGHSVLGLDSWGLVDAALFAVIAWRIYRLSLPWAITGLVVFTVERLYTFVSDPRMGAGLIVAFFFFLAYLHSIRAGLYLRNTKMTVTAPPPPAWATAGYSPVPSEARDDRIEVSCPGCSSWLRIPTGRNGRVRCPRCSHIFEARS